MLRPDLEVVEGAAHHPRARGRRARAAELRAQVLEQHLGEEVVAGHVGQPRELGHREPARGAELDQLAGRRPAGARGADHDDARLAQERAHPPRHVGGRAGLEAAVLQQRAEPPADVAVGPVAGPRAAAAPVEARLVAEDPALDVAHAGGAHVVDERPQRRVAQRRVPAADHVQVAGQRAVLEHRRRGGDAGLQLGVGPEAQQRGRRHEELLDRGRDALLVRADGDELAPRAHLAGVRAAERRRPSGPPRRGAVRAPRRRARPPGRPEPGRRAGRRRGVRASGARKAQTRQAAYRFGAPPRLGADGQGRQDRRGPRQEARGGAAPQGRASPRPPWSSAAAASRARSTRSGPCGRSTSCRSTAR